MFNYYILLQIIILLKYEKKKKIIKNKKYIYKINLIIIYIIFKFYINIFFFRQENVLRN